MTSPKEALEYGLEAVRESFASAKTRDEQLLAEARYSAIESALASLQGEDAVERVARLIFFAANDGIEYDTPTNDSLWYAWKDDPSSVEYWQAARAILATGLVLDEAATIKDHPQGETIWKAFANLYGNGNLDPEDCAYIDRELVAWRGAEFAPINSNLISIIADIREKTGLGGKPMLNELADAIAAEMDQRVADEREKCAKVAEEECYSTTGRQIAAAIRSGGGQ